MTRDIPTSILGICPSFTYDVYHSNSFVSNEMDAGQHSDERGFCTSTNETLSRRGISSNVASKNAMKSLIESGAAMLNSEEFVDECINTIMPRYGADLGGQEYDSHKEIGDEEKENM